jgi:hypothetical protein
MEKMVLPIIVILGLSGLARAENWYPITRKELVCNGF